MTESAVTESPSDPVPVQEPHDGCFTLRVTSREELEAAAVGPSSRQEHTHVCLVVEGWSPPRAGWTGQVGFVPELRSLRADVSPSSATVELRTETPVRLVDLIRAAYSFFYPAVQQTATVTTRTSFASDVPSQVRAWSPTAVPPAVEVEPEESTLVANDLVVATAPEALDEVETVHAVVADPARAWVGSDGAPTAHLDLRVHHPIGRRDGAGAAATAWCDDAGVHVMVGDRPRLTLRWERPLGDAEVAKLRDVARLDLASARAPEGRERALGDRLAEVAATGVALHDGRHLPSGCGLAAEVLAFARRPWDETLPADAVFRSVRQRRAAMRLHGVLARPSAAGVAVLDGRLPSVSVVLSTRRPERVAEIVGQFARQSYPRRELVVVCHGVEPPEVVPRDDLDVQILAVDAAATLGEALAAATERTSGELVTKVDDDDYYGPDHLWDLVLARATSQATLVGKQHEFIYLDGMDVTIRRPLRAEQYVPAVAGGTLLISRADLGALGGWRPVARAVDRGLLLAVARAGGLVYATAPHGYVYVRHADGHTWERPDGHFLKSAAEHWTGLYAPALGIPTSRPGDY